MSKVLVSFIQDRSGSMSDNWHETCLGFKEFVKNLRENKDGTEYLFSLTTFDTEIDKPYIAVPINEVDGNHALDNYGPRGWTALYDAAGKTIQDIETNRHGCEKIIVVISTDGAENSSREWKKDALHASIDAKLNAGDWTFTYLGTQPETWADGAALGVGAGSSSTFAAAQTQAAYTTVASSINALASSPVRGSRSMLQDFTTRSVRMAANMKTAQDDEDDRKSRGKTTIPRPVMPPPTPRTSKTSSRRWK